MSLTEREKEIALRCWFERNTKANNSITEMFDRFLSRIREEQGTYGYVSPNDFNLNGHKFILDCSTDINNVPLFTIPPAAPDCSELVEVLERCHSWLQGSEPHRAKYVGEALANHAKRMNNGKV